MKDFQDTLSMPILPLVQGGQLGSHSSKANVQLKLSIPIGAKVEIIPKGFTLGVKAAIEKIFSICPSY
jgi:hypothetical protein